ncbi:sensor domain-containing diguanylate cyclase [Halomonas borealis]|uniref:sensor domain-containing diguanylate cyclase n=1 Tax=Halomonas borealis TaxID=2508710 RepID=UPI0027B8D503|nr:diguanylate cyclase [Halomonas borealis]
MLFRWSTCKRLALSLKGRLMLGMIATWVVGMALLLVFGWRTGDTLLDASNHTHLRYEARLIANDLTEQVDSRLDALTRLSTRLESETIASSEALQHSDGLLEWFDQLIVTDSTGRLTATWPDNVRLHGVDLAFRDYFRQVRAFRRPHVSEPILSLPRGVPVVLFVVPRRDDDGRFAGLMGGVVRLNGDGLFRRLDRLRLGREGYATVMSASGTFLYHPRRDRVLESVPDSQAGPWRDLALLGWEGEAEEVLANGTSAYLAYRQIWPANWVVGVTLPRHQVMAPLEGWWWRLGWWILPLAGLMLPVTGWLLWLALRPLLRLESQIEEVGQGRRGQVTLNTRMHELQQVAETFNRVEVERSHALARLEDRQAFLDAVLASSPAGMFVTDTRGNITYMTPALVELVGFDESETCEGEWMRHIHPDDRQSARDLWHFSMQSGQDFQRQYRYGHRHGEQLWLEVHARRVAIGERIIGFVGTVKDITQRREEEALRQWEAEHDPLTGLLNRRGFERRLDEALADWRKTGTPSSLILFDLDHFKPLNDEGGHALGDAMLCRIARAVAGEVRRSDHVARQGGDEFAVLLPGCSVEQADKAAQALIRGVGSIEVTHRGRAFRVTLSLGVTSFQPQDERIDTIIGRADDAAYRAKREGRNRAVRCAATADG